MCSISVAMIKYNKLSLNPPTCGANFEIVFQLYVSIWLEIIETEKELTNSSNDWLLQLRGRNTFDCVNVIPRDRKN